jgi:hypothetical protein
MNNNKLFTIFALVILLTVGFSFSAFAGGNNEEINEYGGITIEITDTSILQNNNMLRILEYYDGRNNIVKRVLTPNEFLTNERGLIEQIEYYGEENVIRYEMLFSEEFRQKHDYNRVVEFVQIAGNNRVVVRTIWLINDTVIDVIDFPRNMNEFQFFNIQYIENALFDVNDSISNGNSIVFSARYHSIRSVIRFDTNLIELNETDYDILLRFTAAPTGNITQNFLSFYRNKVRVFHENKYYWLFVHSQIEHLINGQNATISYIPMIMNGELFLLGIGFYYFN